MESFCELNPSACQEITIGLKDHHLFRSGKMGVKGPDRLTHDSDENSSATQPIVRGRLMISVDTELCLRRTIRLPVVRASSLPEVLLLDLLRVAPVDPNTIIAAHRILEKDDGRKALIVEQIAFKRTVLQPVLAWLERQGRSADAIVFRDPQEGLLDVALALDGSPFGSVRHRRWLVTMTWALTGLIVIGLTGQAAISWRLEEHRETVAVWIEKARVPAERVLSAIQRKQSDSSRIAALIQWKHDRRSIPAVLAELTDLLPDHSYLEGINGEGGQFTVTGRSKSAESLITLIEKSPLFEAAVFAAPVMRNPGDEYSRVSVQMRISHQGERP